MQSASHQISLIKLVLYGLSYTVSGWQQFRQAALSFRYRQQSIIFVRKTLQVIPCEIKKASAFLSSQKRPAFFDEDDVCDGFQSCHAACLNYCRPSPYDDGRGEIHSIWQADRASFRMSSNSLTEEHGA